MTEPGDSTTDQRLSRVARISCGISGTFLAWLGTRGVLWLDQGWWWMTWFALLALAGLVLLYYAVSGRSSSRAATILEAALHAVTIGHSP